MAINQTRYTYPVVGNTVYLHFDPTQKWDPGTALTLVLAERVHGVSAVGVKSIGSVVGYQLDGIPMSQGVTATADDASLNLLLTAGNLYTAFGIIYDGSVLVARFAVTKITVSVQTIGTPTRTVTGGSINLKTGTLYFSWSSLPATSSVKSVVYELAGTTVQTYKYVGRTTGRLPISDLDPLTSTWTKDIPFNQFMLANGFRYLETLRPLATGATNASYQAVLTTSYYLYEEPGLYVDVWFPVTADGPIGPFIQYFRLESNIYGGASNLLAAWYDLILFPTGVPFPTGANTINFPMTVAVVPIYRNVKDPSTFLAFKAMLSSLMVELTEVYFVEDEKKGVLDPEVLVWAGSNLFDSQVMNFFSGTIPQTIFDTPGTYSLNFRVRTRTSVNSFMPTNGYRDFWKTITVSRSRKTSIDEPIAACFPSNPVATGTKDLCSMVVAYDDKYHQLGYASEVAGMMHEPRSDEPMAVESALPTIKFYKLFSEHSDLAGNSWNTGFRIVPTLPPLVVLDRSFLQSERSFGADPSDTSHFGCNSKSITFDSSVTTSNFRMAFAEVDVDAGSASYLGTVLSKVLDVSSAAVSLSPPYYVWDLGEYGGDPTFCFIFLAETNDVLNPGRFVLKSGVETRFVGRSLQVDATVIEGLVPEVDGDRLFKIVAFYSSYGRTEASTAKKIVCEKFESSLPVIRLSASVDLGKFPVIAFYGNRPLVPNLDYTVSGNIFQPLYDQVPGTRLTIYYGAKS